MGELLEQRPWREIPMAEVAARAGVSRQTLYKAYGSREAFAQAYVLREADRFLAAVEATIAGHLDDASAALTAAFELFLVAAARHPLVRTIVARDDDDELLSLVTVRGEPLLDHATGRLARFLVDGWPGIAAEDARRLADLTVRLAISYAAAPGGDSPARTAAGVGRVFEPFIERALAARA